MGSGRSAITELEHEDLIFPTLRQALKAYQRVAHQSKVPLDEE